MLMDGRMDGRMDGGMDCSWTEGGRKVDGRWTEGGRKVDGFLTSYRYRDQTLTSFFKAFEHFFTVHKINLDRPT